jgi:3-deoxy-D-manno-octulosonic-acid transferase
VNAALSPRLRPPLWYRALASLALPAGAAWGQRGDAAGRRERARGGGHAADLWLHAASLGEAAGALPVWREIRHRRPAERAYATAVTPGGRARWGAGDGGLRVGTLPFDAPGPVRRAVDRVRASRVLVFETELWPEWLAACLASGASVALANARLSERSARHYRRLAQLFRPLLERFTAVAAETAADAERWQRLGVRRERIAVTGSGKLDALPILEAPHAAAARRQARRELALPEEGIWIAWGSLRPGEERWLERAAQLLGPVVRHLVVPRHPERWHGRTAAERDTAHVWLRRLGVLPLAYRAADLAVVGGTLEAYGGHSPVEPAALGVPALLGPHRASCRETAAALLAAGGARAVETPEELSAALAEWIHDQARRRRAGEAARGAMRRLAGSSARTVDWLEECGFWA